MDSKLDSDSQPRDSNNKSALPSQPDPTREKTEVPNTSTSISTGKQDPTKELRREFRWFEGVSLGLQIVLAVIGIGALCIYNGQLSVMQGTLEEMRRSGQASTNQIWRAIDNFNWLARSMDDSSKAAQEGVTVARDNFIKDRRPYVAISVPRDAVFIAESGKKVRWDIQFINYGRSPAIRMSTKASVWFGVDAYAKMEAFFSKLPITNPNPRERTILPPVVGGGGRDTPGYQFTSVSSESELKPSDAEFITTTKGIVVASRSWYNDLSGRSYYTDFCQYTMKSGAFANCKEHNDIH